MLAVRRAPTVSTQKDLPSRPKRLCDLGSSLKNLLHAGIGHPPTYVGALEQVLPHSVDVPVILPPDQVRGSMVKNRSADAYRSGVPMSMNRPALR